MRMAEIPGQDAPGPGAHLIPAVEEVLLLADQTKQRPEVEEAAPPLPGALLQEVPPEEPSARKQYKASIREQRQNFFFQVWKLLL